MENGVTSGISVVELGDDIAVAYAGKLLADYGADVLKVELPGGDSLRTAGPFPDAADRQQHGGLFESLNSSKQSVTIDWHAAEGRELLQRLAAGADIVLHPLDAATRSEAGFGTDAFPSELVEVAVTPCGLDGPYADDEHTPLTLAGLGGWMHAMGDQGEPPLYPGGPYISYLTGTSAATGALIALRHRRESGEGQLVEVSEFETAIAMLPYDTLQFSYAGLHRHRSGDLYGDNPLAAIYPCKDGYVQFQVGFRPVEFLEMIGGPELGADPRFQNAESRSEHREVLKELILDWLKDQERWELFEECGKRRLVFAAVPDVSEVLELEPHRQRDYFSTRGEGLFKGIRFPGPAIRFGDSDWRQERAPREGEHNAGAWTERLGVEPGQLVQYRERGTL